MWSLTSGPEENLAMNGLHKTKKSLYVDIHNTKQAEEHWSVEW